MVAASWAGAATYKEVPEGRPELRSLRGGRRKLSLELCQSSPCFDVWPNLFDFGQKREGVLLISSESILE